MMVATIPITESDQAVMLVGSATTNRWKNQGSDQKVISTINSFNASPSPKTSMKVRAKQKDTDLFL